MSSAVASAQQPMTPRARHKYSKSAVQASDSEGAQGFANRQRPNRQGHARHVAQPAWQNSNSTVPVEGFFDANGNFVMASQGNGMIRDGSPSEDTTNPSTVKRTTKKQRAKSGQPRQNGNTPPPQIPQQYTQTVVPPTAPNMTPAKGTAYAGPTFHASPAASALPIPKFFSKSVPAETTQPSFQARLDQESDKSDNSESPPLSDAVPAIPTPPRNEESPLDFLFKADKEQKAKRKSTGLLSTPPVKQATDSINTEPPRSGHWQSIYGSTPKHHNRQASNGSGKEMFMMELDGSSTSPQPHKVSPPHVPAERLSSTRSVTAPSLIPQTAPPAIRNNQFQQVYNSPMYGHSMPTLPYNSDPHHYAPAAVDSSASPFYRPMPSVTPRSADSTPIPTQNGGYNPQNLHYGNRNLSPLFKAAQQDSVRRTSSLRQEVHVSSPKMGMAELPDNTESALLTPTRRSSSKTDHAAMAHLQSRLPATVAIPKFDLPKPNVPGPLELDGRPKSQVSNSTSPQPSNTFSPATQQAPRSTTFNAKSIEDDLKRMLKLSLGGSMPDAPSVR